MGDMNEEHACYDLRKVERMDTQPQTIDYIRSESIQCWYARTSSGWFGKLHVPSELAASIRGLTTGLDRNEETDDVVRELSVCRGIGERGPVTLTLESLNRVFLGWDPGAWNKRESLISKTCKLGVTTLCM